MSASVSLKECKQAFEAAKLIADAQEQSTSIVEDVEEQKKEICLAKQGHKYEQNPLRISPVDGEQKQLEETKVIQTNDQLTDLDQAYLKKTSYSRVGDEVSIALERKAEQIVLGQKTSNYQTQLSSDKSSKSTSLANYVSPQPLTVDEFLKREDNEASQHASKKCSQQKVVTQSNGKPASTKQKTQQATNSYNSRENSQSKENMTYVRKVKQEISARVETSPCFKNSSKLDIERAFSREGLAVQNDDSLMNDSLLDRLQGHLKGSEILDIERPFSREGLVAQNFDSEMSQQPILNSQSSKQSKRVRFEDLETQQKSQVISRPKILPSNVAKDSKPKYRVKENIIDRNTHSLQVDASRVSQIIYPTHQEYQVKAKNNLDQSQKDTKRGRKQQIEWQRDRDKSRVEQTLNEILLLNTNIRGLNQLSKQEAISKVIQQIKPHIVCLNETKLKQDFYHDGYWSYQTMSNRKGGCWTAATTNSKHVLVKALGSYFCWTRLIAGLVEVQIINCYLEGGDDLANKSRAQRVIEIVRDILRQNASAAIVVCGDFNNHLQYINTQMKLLQFQHALDEETITHKQGNLLDQVYTKNLDITNAIINDDYDHAITDHKCILVTLKTRASHNMIQLAQHNQNFIPDDHSSLKQGTLRKLINLESTIQEMLNTSRVINRPAFEYIDCDIKNEAIKQEQQKSENRIRSLHQHVKYHTRKQMQEEIDELAISTEFDEIKDIKNLTKLMREGKMKEFYQLANKVLRIKRNHPVVTKVQRPDEHGEIEVIDDKHLAEQAIAKYFANIYKRPQHMKLPAVDVDTNVDQIMSIDDHDHNMQDVDSECIPLFSTQEISEAAKVTNYNKGLGPDCFDGNVMQNNKKLNDKIIFEITDALNSHNIPEYLRMGRLVPLQKTQTKGPVDLDAIRPIVVRSHISKIMEKAILSKVKDTCPYLIESRVYQTGFKEGKSTAIHASRLLEEVHGKRKRKFNILIDLQKAYDSVDREILWKLLLQRAKNDNDKQLIQLMTSLHRESTIQIGTQHIEAEMGLPQGSILSPVLFNVYLEEAIKSSWKLEDVRKRGDLLAFADDMLVMSNSKNEAELIINELANLEKAWNLKLNKKKSEILTQEKLEEINGIKCTQSVKYLGVKVVLDRKEQNAIAKDQINKNISMLRHRLKRADADVLAQLTCCLARSILIYIGTPMVAVGLWNKADIDRIEASQYRKILGCNNKISNKVILNTMTHIRLAGDAIMQLVKNVYEQYKRQNRLTKYFDKDDESVDEDDCICPCHQQSQPNSRISGVGVSHSREHKGQLRCCKPRDSIMKGQQTQKPRQYKMYIPRILAEMMQATTSNSTSIHFGMGHMCHKHNKLFTLDHIKECDALTGCERVPEFANKLRTTPFIDWEKEDKLQAIGAFALLTIQLNNLTMQARASLVQSQPVNAYVKSGRRRGRPSKKELTSQSNTKINQFYTRTNDHSTA